MGVFMDTADVENIILDYLREHLMVQVQMDDYDGCITTKVRLYIGNKEITSDFDSVPKD
jgi:hypothetical protein